MFNFDNSNSIAFSFWFLLVEWRLFRSACEHHSRVYHWQILTLKKKSAQWNRPCREQKPTRWSLKKRNIFRSTPLRDCWDVFLPFTTLVFFIFFFFFVSRCLSVWPSGDWNAVDVAMRFGLLGQVGTGQLGAMIAIIKPRWTIISRLSDDGSIFFLPTPPPPPAENGIHCGPKADFFIFILFVGRRTRTIGSGPLLGFLLYFLFKRSDWRPPKRIRLIRNRVFVTFDPRPWKVGWKRMQSQSISILIRFSWSSALKWNEILR